MADTWNANASNQCCTGNAIRDGASATGLYTIILTIPSGLNNELLTINDLNTYTDIPIENSPLVLYFGNQCPPKSAILDSF